MRSLKSIPLGDSNWAKLTCFNTRSVFRVDLKVLKIRFVLWWRSSRAHSRKKKKCSRLLGAERRQEECNYTKTAAYCKTRRHALVCKPPTLHPPAIVFWDVAGRVARLWSWCEFFYVPLLFLSHLPGGKHTEEGGGGMASFVCGFTQLNCSSEPDNKYIYICIVFPFLINTDSVQTYRLHQRQLTFFNFYRNLRLFEGNPSPASHRISPKSLIPVWELMVAAVSVPLSLSPPSFFPSLSLVSGGRAPVMLSGGPSFADSTPALPRSAVTKASL